MNGLAAFEEYTQVKFFLIYHQVDLQLVQYYEFLIE